MMKTGVSEVTPKAGRSAGFSLLELLIALAITLVVLTLASTLLAASFRVSSRENARTDALADTRRALTTMSREIANAGYRLPSAAAIPTNGIAATSNATSIRVLTNNAAGTPDALTSPNEDVIFQLATDAAGNRFIVRHDVNGPAATRTSVVANRIDAFNVRYFDRQVTYTTAAPCNINVTTAGVTDSTDITRSRFVVLSVCTNLPQVGTPNSPGFQPAGRVQLTSNVTLRNSDLGNY
jgi:prepilin-type N-terminal cleavage/methylation domain-containing protein